LGFYTDGWQTANSGLGYELASQLLADPSKHVILCSRSVEKGEKALSELRAQGKPGSIDLLELDVTKERSVENAACIVKEKYGRYAHY
jgi:NAD(P)-dependent dehydrogenase (short-subunit alcohol dehydrogenase family)